MKLQTIMLFRDNKLMPVDNTGVKLVKCIRVIHKTKKIARIGDLLGVFVKKFKKRKKLLKKVLYYGLIISIKASILRPDGTWLKSDHNRIVLLSSKSQFLGSTIKGPIYKEIRNQFTGQGRHRHWKFDKVVSKARRVI